MCRVNGGCYIVDICHGGKGKYYFLQTGIGGGIICLPPSLSYLTVTIVAPKPYSRKEAS